MLLKLKQGSLRLLNLILIAAVAVLVLDVLLGVASRYLWGAQVKWTEELATILLIWVSFLGAPILELIFSPHGSPLPPGGRRSSSPICAPSDSSSSPFCSAVPFWCARR